MAIVDETRRNFYGLLLIDWIFALVKDFFLLSPNPVGMAKSKNHTAHNQTKKDHRNGIYKPKKQRYISTRGMDQKFLRNQRYAKANNWKGAQFLQKQGLVFVKRHEQPKAPQKEPRKPKKEPFVPKGRKFNPNRRVKRTTMTRRAFKKMSYLQSKRLTALRARFDVQLKQNIRKRSEKNNTDPQAALDKSRWVKTQTARIAKNQAKKDAKPKLPNVSTLIHSKSPRATFLKNYVRGVLKRHGNQPQLIEKLKKNHEIFVAKHDNLAKEQKEKLKAKKAAQKPHLDKIKADQAKRQAKLAESQKPHLEKVKADQAKSQARKQAIKEAHEARVKADQAKKAEKPKKVAKK
jgi:large subunit ribosomal protein L29e